MKLTITLSIISLYLVIVSSMNTKDGYEEIKNMEITIQLKQIMQKQQGNDSKK